MDQFAEVCEVIASHASRDKKARIAAEYLASLNESDREIAAAFFENRRKSPVSWTIVRDALMNVTAWDEETLRACRDASEDAGELAALLIRNRTRGESMTLERAQTYIEELTPERSARYRRETLEEIFSSFRPLAVKYLIRVLNGNLRIGLAKADAQTAGNLRAAVTSFQAGEYTLAIRSADEFVNIGKAHATFSDAESEALAKLIRKHTIERFGRVSVLKPAIVFEIEYSSVKLSKRKSGFTLESPRVVRWLPDCKPEDCTDKSELQ